ncbi:MAG: DUF819 domain-containing protein [Campylobacterales bacterium]|nr:DUF819 domain-containing protein [Campylobacterales bacterium]
MIENGFLYISLLCMIVLIAILTEKKLHYKLFEYLPIVVILYAFVMMLSFGELFAKNETIGDIYTVSKAYVLPAMIFLMLLNSNIQAIFKLSKKMLLVFFLAMGSIMFSFISIYFLFKPFLESNAWKAFGALSGSWMGGTANMVAIADSVKADEIQMGYVLISDSINYTFWVMLLLTLAPYALRFNRWSKAKTDYIDSLDIPRDNIDQNRKEELKNIVVLIIVALGISIICQNIAPFLPTGDFVSQTTWIVIIATSLGLVGSMGLLKKLHSPTLATALLYLIIALIASRATLQDIDKAPLYILAGTAILSLHAIIMIIFAKIFKLDLFIIAVASLANIGGVASAPILAGAYSKTLIPIGVIMAMFGYILGTFGGLIVAKILSII